MPLTLPLVAWGAAEDFTAWTEVGTSVRAYTQTDPFGGTGAVKLTDDNAGATEGILSPSFTVLAGKALMAGWVRGDTSTQSFMSWFDVTAAAYRAVVALAWAGGVPTPSLSSGSATIYSAIATGGGWYLIRALVDGIVGANSQRLEVYPSTFAGTGSVFHYVRHVVLLNQLDNVATWEDWRKGSEAEQGASGVETSWDQGTDYRLAADVRWVPTRDEEAPFNVSGYEGLAERAGVNGGVAAMLRAGRLKRDLLFAPDRAAAATYITSKLVQPVNEEPGLERDGKRRLRLGLRSPTTPYGWYL